MNSSFLLKFTKLVLMVVSVASCAALFVSTEEQTAKRNSAKSIDFVKNVPYEQECASCHVGFLPGFLPKRSWNKLMNELNNHFGENADMDKALSDEIRLFLIENAADGPKASLRSHRIANLLRPNETPLRITETPFWTRKHIPIKAYVWDREKIGKKSHCESCHRDAAKGMFTEYDVTIPKK